MAGTYAWNNLQASASLAIHLRELHNNLTVRKPLYGLFFGGKRPDGPMKGQPMARRKPKMKRGGYELRFPLKYGHMSNFQSVGAGDSVTPEEKEGIGHGTATWKYAIGSGVATWQTRQQNSGPQQVIDIVEEIKDDMYDNAGDGIESMLLLDGTGNLNKDILGLAAIVRKTPTTGTLFGIDQSTAMDAAAGGSNFFRNQYKAAYSATFLSGLLGLKDMRSMWNLCSYQSKGSATELTMPDVILMSTNPFESYEALGYELKRINTVETMDLGFRGFRYKSSVILYVPGLDQYMGSTSDVALMLNTKHIWAYMDPAEKWNFTPFREIDTARPKDWVAHVTLVAQLVCDNLSRQGYLEWTDASA